MKFSNLATIQMINASVTRLDAIVKGRPVGDDPEVLARDILNVAAIYENKLTEDETLDRALEDIGGLSCNLEIQLNNGLLTGAYAYVEAVVIEFNDLCKRVERLLLKLN